MKLAEIPASRQLRTLDCQAGPVAPVGLNLTGKNGKNGSNPPGDVTHPRLKPPLKGGCTMIFSDIYRYLGPRSGLGDPKLQTYVAVS